MLNINTRSYTPHPGILVDNFAGGGGASTGMERAFGRPVTIAINHDKAAIEMHKRNHPLAEHHCENVWDVDPAHAAGGRPILAAWFSPDCTHFSRARGGVPKKKNIRGLAWIVTKWAKLPEWQRPRMIFLENVAEFLTWSPLTNDGKVNKRYKSGHTFRKWVKQLEALGYVVDWKIIPADHHGAPTIRKRLFLVARCDGLPIVWPERTHGNPAEEGFAESGLKPWLPAHTIIDWSIKCPSIFERKRPLAENTMNRIAAGLKRFVIDNPDPFIVKVNHHGAGFRGQGLDKPLQTLTSKLGSALVTPIIDAQYGQSRGNSIEKPLAAVTAGGMGKSALVAPIIDRQFGSAPGDRPENDITRPLGAVMSGGAGGKSALVAPILSYGQHGGQSRSPLDPHSTIAASSKDTNQVVTAWIAQHNTGVVGNSAKSPLSTIVGRGTQQQPVSVTLGDEQADAERAAKVAAFLIKYYGNDKDGCSLNGPLHTVTTKDRFAVVTVAGREFKIVDIGMRMLTPRELFNAQGFPPDYDIMTGILPKTQQVAKAGNAVCPPVAAAVAAANAQPYLRAA